MSENTMYVWEMVKEAVDRLGRPVTFMTFIFCSVFLIQCSENRAQMHDIVINEKTIAHSILIFDMEQLTSPFEKSVNYLMILPSFVIDNFELFHFQPNHSEEKYLFQRKGLQF